MKLTEEQHKIIRSEGDIKINAVAGSGKTSTVIEYARSRPAGSRILYLAFNKAVKEEAVRKFADKALKNIRVETAHSLAFNYIVRSYGYKVNSYGYKIHEIVEILGLKSEDEKHAEYVIANHISKFAAYFCNSNKPKIRDLDYLEVVSDIKAKSFVKTFYAYIEKQTRLFLAKMDKGEIPVTHDFYLKKFQLSNPRLPYDYILFDEGQDASPAMLDVFFNQKAVKVIVGDTHQQIYGWRYAVNSLEKANYVNYQLSASFRFGEAVAQLATDILHLKHFIGQEIKLKVNGKGTGNNSNTKAVIARTNLGLLKKAIEYVTGQENVNHIYFEGNINSYTYADEGASIYDILNLRNGKRNLIKDPLIRKMSGLRELEEYIEKTEDMQLGLMLEIVNEHGNNIYDIIKNLKEKHVENEDREKAEVIFSTVHRCKGMEYDIVHLVNDFINEEKLEKIFIEKKKEEIDLAKLNEEINLLYVAVTRAKNILHIPEELIPEGYMIDSPHIRVEQKPEEKPDDFNKAVIDYHFNNRYKLEPDPPKYTYDKARAREKNKDAYRRWTQELDDELTVMFCEGATVDEMARHFGRSKSAINSRINKLELWELYG